MTFQMQLHEYFSFFSFSAVYFKYILDTIEKLEPVGLRVVNWILGVSLCQSFFRNNTINAIILLDIAYTWSGELEIVIFFVLF